MNYITEEIIKEFFFDDYEMFVGVASGFIDEYPEFKEQINLSLVEKNFEEAKNYTHKLSGALSSFRIEILTSMARDVEKLASVDTSADFEKAFVILCEKLEIFLDELENLREKYS